MLRPAIEGHSTVTRPGTWLKRLLPQGLLGRSLLIIVMPLVVLQLVSAYVFYGSHWETVARRLAKGLAGDIGSVIEMSRVTSVFASSSISLTGVSNVFESSLPAGISASVVAPIRACRTSFPRTVRTSAFAVAESA